MCLLIETVSRVSNVTHGPLVLFFGSPKQSLIWVFQTESFLCVVVDERWKREKFTDRRIIYRKAYMSFQPRWAYIFFWSILQIIRNSYLLKIAANVSVMALLLKIAAIKCECYGLLYDLIRHLAIHKPFVRRHLAHYMYNHSGSLTAWHQENQFLSKRLLRRNGHI